jgi:superfamily II DNA or RNA helicase
MLLRDYQLAASDSVFEAWKENVSTLVVMPTGLGKTILFADIVRRVFPLRCMVIAHREELIWQACDKIKRVTGIRAEVEMADYRVQSGLWESPRVVVSTVQTHTAGGDGSGRMTKFDPAEFGALIIDEAHHACSDSYRRVINWYRNNPELKVLGVTATPDRSDEEAMGQVFDSVAYDYEILDAVHNGWLVPILQQFVAVEGLDFSGMRTTAGDLNGADLAAVMEAEQMLHHMAGPTIDIIGKRRALVFCSSVAHADRMAEILNRHRPGMAGWVCGKTPKEDRRQLLRAFSAGDIQVICNCGVLTEGFDDPGVEVIVMGRPTKSRSLYAQMAGRSTRPLPGIVDGLADAPERRAAIEASAKKNCLIVDFVGNSGRHKLCSSGDILGGNVSEEVVESAVRRVKESGKPVAMDEAIEEEIKLAKQAKDREAARRAALTAKANWSMRLVNPFDVWDINPGSERGWHKGKYLTEKQTGLLLKQGINPDMPYHQAKALLDECFRRWDKGLCSFKQSKLLQRFGYSPDMGREDAKATIDKLAKNGWRKV